MVIIGTFSASDDGFIGLPIKTVLFALLRFRPTDALTESSDCGWREPCIAQRCLIAAPCRPDAMTVAHEPQPAVA